MLKLQIKHQFEDFDLDTDFSAQPGVTVLFGASGSGKSTIANVVAGLLKPDQGRVELDGRVLFDHAKGICVPAHKRRVGYIFQDARLFPHLSVRNNLRFGRWFSGITPDARVFDQMVDMLGIGDLLDRRPAHLSGGEKQRVAIGRALLSQPKLLIADEPLAALDQARKAEILPYFERLRDEFDTPILYVSHSSSEVARLATTVVAMADGRVLRQGSAVEIFGDPAVLPLGPRAAGAVLEVTVKAHHSDGLTELLAGGHTLFVPQIPHVLGAKVRVKIAAHDVILARQAPQDISALNILPCTVRNLREGEGPGAIVALDSAAGPFLARITRRSAERLGLEPQSPCFAIVKSVAIAPQDIS